MALISCSVKMRLRPNGGITVNGLRRVSSLRMATSSSRSGYLLLTSLSGGPMVPGSSPPLMSWQVRQLPLLRSKANFWPSATEDCAAVGPANVSAPMSSAAANANAGIKAGLVVGWSGKVSSGFHFHRERRRSDSLLRLLKAYTSAADNGCGVCVIMAGLMISHKVGANRQWLSPRNSGRPSPRASQGCQHPCRLP
jgi:hypothetical protein